MKILENFTFEKPICFFDLETTGLSVTTDRVIEIYIKKVFPDKTFTDFYSKVNPEGKEIATGAIAKHGVTLQSLENEPKFKDIANDILNFIMGCDIGGYNIVDFDIPMLMSEFYRCNITYTFSDVKFIDVKRVYWKMEPRTLEGTYFSFTGKVLENAHQADTDVNATIEIFERQLEKYKNTVQADTKSIHDLIIESNSIDLAGKFIRSDSGDILITFGKYKDESVITVFKKDPKYFEWIIGSDFPINTKMIARQIYEKLKTAIKK